MISTVKESSINTPGSSSAATTVPETGWYLILSKIVAFATFMYIERVGKRPMIVPVQAGTPILTAVSKNAASDSADVISLTNATLTPQFSGAVDTVGIEIWLEGGDKFQVVKSDGSASGSNVRFTMINTKHRPVYRYFDDQSALPN